MIYAFSIYFYEWHKIEDSILPYVSFLTYKSYIMEKYHRCLEILIINILNSIEFFKGESLKCEKPQLSN